MDFVVTNHESGNAGAVFAYEVPPNFKSQPWSKHTLLNHIQTHQFGFNSAAPGSPLVFYPSRDKRNKPWIIVSGDGSQQVHLLVPESQNPSDWQYSEHILLNTHSTVGKLAVADVDGNGYPKIFVPAYDNNEIEILTIRPSE